MENKKRKNDLDMCGDNNSVSESELDDSESELDDSESELDDSGSELDDQDNENDQVQHQQTHIQNYNPDILDSIAISRETYLFNLEDQELDTDEQNDQIDVLNYVYEQVANIYADESLIRILAHIRHYYEITFPEYRRDFELFYISVYPQALMIDRRSAGIVQINGTTGQEIPGSFINFQIQSTPSPLINNFINNLINPSDISFNSYAVNYNTLDENSFPTQSNRPHLSSPNDIRSSSLLNEIMFLSSIFNMRSNNSLLHVLNLMNNVLDRVDGLNHTHAQTATQQEIKELGSQTYECVGTDSKEKNSDYCTICQESYESSAQVKILPCGHFFHCECIEPWLLNCSTLCPICRKSIHNPSS